MEAAAQPEPSPFRVSHRMVSEVCVVTVAGEVDAATAPVLRRELAADIVYSASPAVIALDLSEVGFIDSGGLTALVELHRDATERAVPLKIVTRQRAVTRAIDITGLGDLLTVVPDLDQVLPA